MIVHQTETVPYKGKNRAFNGLKLTSFNPTSKPHIFSVVHETSYRYDTAVKKSKHLLRLQPVEDLFQTVLEYELTLSSPGKMCNFSGSFGNHASFIEIQKPYKELTIRAKSVVAVMEMPLESLDLTHQPRIFPQIWMPWDLVMMQAYLSPPELPEAQMFELAEYAMGFVKKNKNDIFATLHDLNQTLYRGYEYMPGETGFSTTPYDVYFHRKGVCQDFAGLFICLARLLNIPARYRMGYLYTGNPQAEESHAWVEVFLPYCGWVGYDPTNGCLAKKNHIRIACGRYYNDATPTSGTIFSGGEGETLTTSVQVRKC